MGLGYLLRVRLASFFAGAAAASAWGFYVLHQDYQASHELLSKQTRDLFASLDERMSALEKLNQNVFSTSFPEQEQPSSSSSSSSE